MNRTTTDMPPKAAATASPWARLVRWFDGLSPGQIVLFGVLAYAAIVILRGPQLFLTPRFWSEEGTIYLHFGLHHGFWDAFFKAHLGYYSIIPNIGGWLAAQVPLIHAPTVTTAIAYAGLLWIFMLALMAPFEAIRSNRARALFALTLMLGYPQTEIWLSTINLQWYFIVATGIVLAAEARRGAYEKVALTTLLIAGLSGPGSIFMAPLFFLRAVIERTGPRMRQAALFVTLAALQTAIVYFNFEEVGAVENQKRSTAFEPYALALVTFFRSFLVLPLGPDIAHAIGSIARKGEIMVSAFNAAGISLPDATDWKALFQQLARAGILISGLIIAAVIVRFSRRTTHYFLAASVFVSVLMTFGALGDGSMYSQIALHHPRYVYPPATLAGLGLCIAALDPARGRLGAAVMRTMLALFLFWGAICFVYGNYLVYMTPWRSGIAWEESIERWIEEPSRGLELWPGNWKYVPDLTPEQMGVSPPPS